MAFVENTERGPRALRAFSLARAARRIFPGFGTNDYLQKAVGWFGVLVRRGSPGVRDGVPRDEA